MDGGLQVRHHAVPELQANRGAAIEAEQIVGLVAEAAVAQVAAEAVGQVEVALAGRQSKRRRQVDEREVGLRNVERCVVVGRLRREAARQPDNEDDSKQGGQRGQRSSLGHAAHS